MHFFWKAMKPFTLMPPPRSSYAYFWMMFLMARMSSAFSSVWKTRSWRLLRSESVKVPVS